MVCVNYYVTKYHITTTFVSKSTTMNFARAGQNFL